MELKEFLKFEVASKIVIICGIITYIGILTAVALSQSWFTWQGNALSDLGVSSVAIIFNSSLFIGGFATAYFAISFILQNKKKIIKLLAGLVLFLNGVDLFLIGLFVEHTYCCNINLHYTVSVIFFVLIPFSMWFMTIEWLLHPETRLMSLVPLLLSVVTPILWLGMKWNGVAIPEFTTSLTFFIWVIFLIYMELHESSSNDEIVVELA